MLRQPPSLVGVVGDEGGKRAGAEHAHLGLPGDQPGQPLSGPGDQFGECGRAGPACSVRTGSIRTGSIAHEHSPSGPCQATRGGGPAPGAAGQPGEVIGCGAVGSRRTTTPLDVGWLLMSATLSRGTRPWVSG